MEIINNSIRDKFSIDVSSSVDVLALGRTKLPMEGDNKLERKMIWID
jgi:hypothetical protein